jgi:hypothetical protein
LKEGITVNLNFFAEKHGKNSRDQHFSTISNFVNAGSLEKRLTSSADIINAIQKHQHIANERRLKLKKEPIKLWITEMPINFGRTSEQMHRKIENIRSLYNLQIKISNEETCRDNSENLIYPNLDDFDSDSDVDSIDRNDAYLEDQNLSKRFKLFTSIFTDLSELIEVKSVYKISKNRTRDTVNSIDLEEEDAILISRLNGLKNKRQKIDIAIEANKAAQKPNTNNQRQISVIPLFCDMMRVKTKQGIYL